MAKTRTRNAKGRFVKGGGGGRSKALVRTRTRTVTKYKTRRAPVRHVRRRARRGGRGGAGVTVGKLAIAGLALGALVGDNSTIAPAQAKAFVQKIPGAKTFGNVAIAGAALGAIGHFTSFGGRFRPWLKAAGYIGVAAAAIKLGTDNTGFKFVGDDDLDVDDLADVDVD